MRMAIKRLLCGLLVLCLALSFVGCENRKETAIQNITSMIQAAYTAPDAILLDNRPVVAVSTGEVVSGDKEVYRERIRELYGKYCENNYVESLMANDIMMAHLYCESSGMICTVDSVIVTPNEDSYQFEATLHYGLESADENDLVIHGHAQTNQEGQITFFKLYDSSFSAMKQALMQ